MDLIQILKWYLQAGVDECVVEIAPNRLNVIDSKKTHKVIPPNIEPAALSVTDTFVQQAVTRAASAETMAELDDALTEFTGCGLSKTAAHLLSGIGVPNPRVMCIIESPRAGDDKAGQLLQDESGTVLANMIKSIGLDYTQDTYIAPISPWRTPGDRSLTETELQQCLPFLKRRIELLNPEILILFGSVVSGALLGISSISKAREKALDYTSEKMAHSIKAFTTFSPVFLGKTAAYRTQRQKAWEDLQKIQQYLIGL